MAAHERLDAAAVAKIAAANIRVTMPPYPHRFEGIDSMHELIDRARAEGEWRLLRTAVNRMPAAASYLRRPGDTEFRAYKLDVLRIAAGLIAEITTFGPAVFDACGLPPDRLSDACGGSLGRHADGGTHADGVPH
jgi:RNA polymerase sigma-70 factor (ECF subfamily)